MATIVEEDFELPDGKKLYMKKWNPTETPRATVVFLHGYSDHCNRYYELFPSLAARGIAVVGFDQRGWGRSAATPAEQGDAGPTARVLADVAAVVQAQQQQQQQRLHDRAPLFIMGHSMGGGIALALASTPAYGALTRDVRGWLLESPHIAIPPAAAPSSLKVAVGRLAAQLLPRVRLSHRVPPSDLTRDEAVVASLEADALCFNEATLETLAAILDRADALACSRYRLNHGVRALWIAHGTADRVTDFGASERYCNAQTAVEDRTFKPYDGWSHQLHADLPETRPTFANDVADWILARTGPAEHAKL